MKKTKWLLFSSMFLVLILISAGYGAEKGDYALYFPASETSNDNYAWWYNLVSLSDPRLHPVGFDFKNTSMTVEVWVRPEKAANGVIIAAGNLSNRKTSDGFALYLWKGASQYALEGCHDSMDYSCVKFAVKSKGVWYAAVAYTLIPVSNEWHHLAGVLNTASGTLTVYVDGNAVKGADDNHPNPKTGVMAMADSGPIFIGANQAITPEETIGDSRKNHETHPGIKHWFKGTMDELRFWKEARTEAQIRACMKQELGMSDECKITDNLATYLKFNEGQGSTLRDSSKYGNNGSSRYYKNAKKVLKDHNLRVGYHTIVQDPESLEIMDPANWVAGFSYR
ncbi:MAG: LamG domain-containing protein [Nitrospirae bacterium]|nr:LamG domain-containing protein [Nitrospirota bacterium]